MSFVIRPGILGDYSRHLLRIKARPEEPKAQSANAISNKRPVTINMKETLICVRAPVSRYERGVNP